MGHTAEKEEHAFRHAPRSQVPFTLLAGGNHNHAAAVRASAVCGGAQRHRTDRSSDLEPLSESSANPAIIRLFKRQSQTSLPLSTCSEHFFYAPQSPVSFFVDAHCAQSLTAHILTIGRRQVVSQRIHKTRVLDGVSGSPDPNELERLGGIWFRGRRATRTESLFSSQALKTRPKQAVAGVSTGLRAVLETIKLCYEVSCDVSP